MKRIYVCAVLFLLLCIFPAKDTKAYSVEVKKDGFLADVISDDIYEGLPNELANLMDEIKQDNDDGFYPEIKQIKDDTKLVLCKPYIYWNALDVEIIFCFPLVREGIILEALQVTQHKGKNGYDYDYCDFEDSGTVDKLNEINYLASDFVIYDHLGIAYAEDEKKQNQLHDISYMFTDVSDDYKKLDDDFYKKSLPQKKEAVREQVLRLTGQKKDGNANVRNLGICCMGSLILVCGFVLVWMKAKAMKLRHSSNGKRL